MKKARICEKCNTINLYHVGNCQRCNSPLRYIDINDAVEYSEEDLYPAKPDNYNDAWAKRKITSKEEGSSYPNESKIQVEKKRSGWWTVLWVILAIFVSFFLVCLSALNDCC